MITVYLADQSTGHGFNYWLFLTALVTCSLLAFCVTPYVLVRATVGRPRARPRRPTAEEHADPW
ncbi:hypothetical protein ACFCVY_12235 [Streptomyces sp. NPDC056411]|uniref:hypothetical protein n=1 Tax=Streptomyces sp. NPDC056411 TaxID=3345813 RepID=UPI0035DD3FDB